MDLTTLEHGNARHWNGARLAAAMCFLVAGAILVAPLHAQGGMRALASVLGLLI